jgi:hypothetical protein
MVAVQSSADARARGRTWPNIASGQRDELLRGVLDTDIPDVPVEERRA